VINCGLILVLKEKLFRDFNISEISLIVNSIIAKFEFVLNSKLGGLQLLSFKFEMEQKKLFRRLH
jgi:hypothetical protein